MIPPVDSSTNYIANYSYPSSDKYQIIVVALKIIPFVLVGYGIYRYIKWKASSQQPPPESLKKFLPSHESINKQTHAPSLDTLIDKARKEPYSFKEVMNLAEKGFEQHTDRFNILEDIENKLIRCNYQECIDQQIAPCLHEEEDVYVNVPNHKAHTDSSINKDIQIRRTILEFLDLLPGVDYASSRKLKMNEGDPLILQGVMACAKNTFCNDPKQEEILGKIQQKLHSCGYERSLRKGTPPYLNSDGYTTSYFFSRLPDEIEIDTVVNRFLRSLPGVDLAPYTGHRLK